MPQSKSIRDFFKPAQTSMKTGASFPAPPSSSAGFQAPPMPATSKPTLSRKDSNTSRSAEKWEETSSLSPPPSSEATDIPQSPTRTRLDSSFQSNGTSSRVVRSSDSEESGSDDSLPDIFKSTNHLPAPNRAVPSTPTASRHRSTQIPLTSPLAIHPKKYKFSIASLVDEAAVDKKSEESSKRVKAMLDQQADKSTNLISGDSNGEPAKLDGALLESVVSHKEDGGMEKVTRALMRTEATNSDQRWYFFNAEAQQPDSRHQPFPDSAVPANWRRGLLKPAVRKQAFLSGFAEDMIHLGQALPDEIFIWILDEACFESHGVLRTSYLNMLQESTEQIERLLSPDVVNRMLQNLGGTSTATTISEKIRPSIKLPSRYHWSPANVGSVILFFTRISHILLPETREHIICMLLRMSADHVVFENVDLLVLLQEAIRRLCQDIHSDRWEISVRIFVT